MKRTLGALLLAGVIVGGCSSTEPETESPPKQAGETTESSLPDVDWSQYSPLVKKRIDQLAKKSNCNGLQREFDTADNNGSADLMEYIHAQLGAAGCY